MPDSNDAQVGKLEGMLSGLKEFVEFRFDKLEDSMEKTIEAANDAKLKADAADKKANDAQEYSQGLVKKAGWVSGIVASCVGGIFYFIDHLPKFFVFISSLK